MYVLVSQGGCVRVICVGVAGEIELHLAAEVSATERALLSRKLTHTRLANGVSTRNQNGIHLVGGADLTKETVLQTGHHALALVSLVLGLYTLGLQCPVRALQLQYACHELLLLQRDWDARARHQ